MLTDDQRTIFKQWIEDGGGFIGVHAAGDDSHQWAWYEDEVLQAHFSHHNIGQDLDTHLEGLLYGELRNIGYLKVCWTLLIWLMNGIVFMTTRELKRVRYCML